MSARAQAIAAPPDTELEESEVEELQCMATCLQTDKNLSSRLCHRRPARPNDDSDSDSDSDAVISDTMATTETFVQLAKALPSRLQRFIARYPAASILPAGTDPETYKTSYQQASVNPFKSQKHPVTGKWHDPVYSLRRQAELVKLAREHGVEELLPPTVKGTEHRIAHRVEHGLRVKGTGVGQKVKGHRHERMVMPKMEKKRESMLNMPSLMREWKKVGKSRWRKWPKGPKK